MELLTMREVPSAYMRMTRGKRKPSVAAVYRWVKKGVAGVKLRVDVYGGTSYTSVEYLQEFDREIARRRAGPSEVRPSTGRQLGIAHAKAKERLRRRA